MQLALEDLESLGSTANRQLTELGQKNSQVKRKHTVAEL